MIHRRILLIDFILMLLVFSAVSCGNTDTERMLASVANIVEQRPDSALTLLDSISNPDDLNEKERNLFLLLQTQAKDKSYKDITADTVIFQVRDYYRAQNDAKNLALSSFYCGRVWQEQEKPDSAIAEFLKADTYARNTGNVNLRGLSQSHIGQIFLDQLMQKQAIPHFERAARQFHKVKNTRNEIITYNQIGNAYSRLSISDSAFYYYNRGLELARADNDSLQTAWLLQSIGATYQETGKYDLAELYTKNAAKHTKDANVKIKLYLNLSKIFQNEGLPDSAKIYLNKSIALLSDHKDVFVTASIYKTLSQISEEQSDFKQALNYHKQYAINIAKIADGNKSKEILELQEKYHNERLKNENNRIEARAQKIYLSLSVALLIICLIALFFYLKSVRRHRAILQKENELLEKDNELLEARTRIYQLLEMSKSYNGKVDSNRDVLLHHFDILKKVSLLREYLREDDEQSMRLVKKVNKIVYGQDSMNWDLLYRDMNNIHNGLFSRLRERYPTLDETEFRICCLTYCGFSCPESGAIMGLSTNTVYMKRTLIRKKLGMDDQENIKVHLDTLFAA